MCGAQTALTAALSEDGALEEMGMSADADPATVATMMCVQVGMVSSGSFQIEGCSTATPQRAGASACGRAMPLSVLLVVVTAVLGQF